MTAKRGKTGIFLALVSLLLSLIVFGIAYNVHAEMVTLEEDSVEANIKLVDVSIGSTKEGNACIFEINGKTVVVERRETKTQDGITIYVQEVYPVNTKSQDKDVCEFLYSIAEETEKKESSIKKEIIGDQTINFLLGTREQLSAEQETEIVGSVIQDNTIVRINGYDVTKQGITSEEEIQQKEQQKSDEESGEGTEENEFFAKLWLFLFG